MPRPMLVLFNVNETLSDLEPLRARFEEVGAPGALLETWFCENTARRLRAHCRRCLCRFPHRLARRGQAGARCALVAVHPWDVDGAKRAGLQAGWLNRRNAIYPTFLEAPDATGETLGTLADALVADR